MNEMPHVIPAEQAVLGALMFDSSVYESLSPILSAESFHNPVHARIYQTCENMLEAGQLVDVLSVKARLAKNETLIDIGGEKYLAELMQAAPSSSTLVEYSKLIKEMHVRRQGITLFMEAKDKLADPESDEAYNDIDQIISDLVRLQRSGSGQQSFGSTQEAVEALFNPDRPLKIETGFTALDRVAGFARGGLTLLGGRASMGKSALMIEAAFNAARRGLRVDLFSLEMGREQIAARAISSQMARDSLASGLISSIPYQRIIERKLTAPEWDKIKAAAKELPAINFDDTPRLSVSDIKARCLDKAGQLDLIFIDYLNIMDLSDCKQADRHDQKLGLVASKLRDFAKDTGAAVILGCQLNRGNTSRENNVPQLHDLRDSGELEQHADTVLFVHRQAYYMQRDLDAKQAAGERISNEEYAELEALKNRFEVIVAKQRMGQIGKAGLKCDMRFNYVGDFDR